MKFTQEHEELRRTARAFVEKEINPNVKEWEENGPFPAHELFKKMGNLGLLGICKPVEYGGMGLDYSYNLVVADEIGRAHCGGVPLAIGVQTDMATPALARFGSEELKREFLAPAIAGDYVAAIAVSEPHAGSDVAAIEYAEEISSVLVDEIIPDKESPDGARTVMHWYDDRMEPNNGNGTDPARYVRLKHLVETIAATPLEGEPCADAPGGVQAWVDRDHVLERLEEVVRQCRSATASKDCLCRPV